MKKNILLFLKGMAMGVANVIPGVSGGTIALITGIYEELIHSLKRIDKNAMKHIISLNLSEFVKYTNFYFLLYVFGGSIVSVFSIASLFKFLFTNHPILIWSFFFGLILASVFFVGKRVKKWDYKKISILLIGATVALSISFLTPANENSNLIFVFLCGVIGISGMILPGLSGSFILILMGNYELLMVKAVTELNIIILSIFCLGSIFGLMSFSHILSWIFKHYKSSLLALLTGFILGSLNIIWPWKEVTQSSWIGGKEKVLSYSWYLPQEFNIETLTAVILVVFGIGTVWIMENFSNKGSA